MLSKNIKFLLKVHVQNDGDSICSKPYETVLNSAEHGKLSS